MHEGRPQVKARPNTGWKGTERRPPSKSRHEAAALGVRGLRERATVSRRWLGARLEMGRYAYASRAPRKMNPGSPRPFQQARAKLQLLHKNRLTKSMNTNCLMGDPFIKQNEPPSRMAQLFRQMVG